MPHRILGRTGHMKHGTPPALLDPAQRPR